MTKSEIIFEVLDEIEKFRPTDVICKGNIEAIINYAEGFNDGRNLLFSTIKTVIENMLDTPC